MEFKCIKTLGNIFIQGRVYQGSIYNPNKLEKSGIAYRIVGETNMGYVILKKSLMTFNQIGIVYESNTYYFLEDYFMNLEEYRENKLNSLIDE